MNIYLLNLKDRSYNFLRRCGYSILKDGSFVRRITGDYYPRFHIYVEKERRGEVTSPVLVLNLHLDEKKPSYKNQPAHSGKYQGELVKKEAERIKNEASSA